ncbi:hypothetical protein BTI_1923 [Burkholderia thailandensis MSMB121]|uniref:Uncharacterized protein n=2 Tax=Burkholderia humptydooensis TaxID=430531 RepID=A0A7U4P462_9BURK|nr:MULTISPECIES: hypothetical protein [Burkholderia]AGK47862.1 hypothetical protein BTI_1923 [Burkholderia thailandensis MSMB121]ATF36963.1 hypothetical protein CO709_29445 [Burkholderia thailandensis]AJY43806.1 hypothetical protein BW21_2031 [Burkholderia sp. 2002721687]ALX42630.1 hypothetical protein AQ610_09525 [Burkholderia humptydooensis]EIP87814.1 hypothetical protein A33K_15835 [Burkholderia humptydooensis MSMB43]
MCETTNFEDKAMVRLTRLEDELAADTCGERRDACLASLREPVAGAHDRAATPELDEARRAAIEVIERLWARYHNRP